MKRRGKNLKIFLMDGTASGRWMCELSNWTGKAYRIPRISYKETVHRDELRKPSIYFLFGIDDETDERMIYIGETEDAIQRLGQHIRDDNKNYWIEVIVFISKDDHLNKAHIKYLERRLYDIALEVGRYEVKNSSSPTQSVISEAEESEMEEFIDNVRLVVSAMGHKVFEPLIPVVEQAIVTDTDAISDTVYLHTKGKIIASGLMVPDGFIVQKGATLNDRKLSSHFPKSLFKMRKQYQDDGTLQNSTLMQDILFSSPSAAATFILGYPASGPQLWKTEDGVILRELEG
ncbi:GIY-YIG nuclease family protein [Dolosigranulum savutiense]|uniref:GIY-YIG nuclease family protein n=1 Tax=Dolosigranulum savutiense TaxID=3110288 RepID=A0AB74TV37_9LACT